jgi:hypothetical protein
MQTFFACLMLATALEVSLVITENNLVYCVVDAMFIVALTTVIQGVSCFSLWL